MKIIGILILLIATWAAWRFLLPLVGGWVLDRVLTSYFGGRKIKRKRSRKLT